MYQTKFLGCRVLLLKGLGPDWGPIGTRDQGDVLVAHTGEALLCYSICSYDRQIRNPVIQYPALQYNTIQYVLNPTQSLIFFSDQKTGNAMGLLGFYISQNLVTDILSPKRRYRYAPVAPTMTFVRGGWKFYHKPPPSLKICVLVVEMRINALEILKNICQLSKGNRSGFGLHPRHQRGKADFMNRDL
mgnify:CR=1 FL=1